MTNIYLIPLMAMAMLITVPGAAHAQHVAGGMGEEVRIGAFSGPTYRINGRDMAEGRRLDSSKPGKGLRQGTSQHAARPTGARGPAPTLPGRHLP